MITAEATNDRSDFAKSIGTRLEFGLNQAFGKSSRQLRNEFISTFETGGLKPGFGGRWDKTTFIALTKRKTYPKSTAAQKAYRKNFKTLVDTGSYRDSIKQMPVKRKLPVMEYLIGSTQAKKAALHEFGGVIVVDGRTFDVPIRSFHYLTEGNISMIDDSVLSSLRAATK